MKTRHNEDHRRVAARNKARRLADELGIFMGDCIRSITLVSAILTDYEPILYRPVNPKRAIDELDAYLAKVRLAE